MEVHCTKCAASLWIISDSINAVYEMLLFDCVDLLENKQYAYCVLNASQAFESFASLFLRVRLCYRPYAREQDGDLTSLNTSLAELYAVSKDFGFAKLRAIVSNLILQNAEPTTLTEARRLIRSIAVLTSAPSKAVIAGHGDQRVALLLRKLQLTRVHECRNKVVHQRAFRPTRAQAEAAVEEARSILFPLGDALGILGDDILMYLHRA